MKIDFKEFNEILGRIDNGYHEAALKLGLSDSELDILYVLAAHDHMCLQSTLYKETWMTRSTVNSAIKKMEREGFLYLTAGEGRNTCVHITDEGQRRMDETVFKLIAVENEIYESWTEEERKIFIRLNRDYAEKLSQKVKNLSIKL